MTEKALENLLTTDVETFIKGLEAENSSHTKLEEMLKYMQLQLSHGKIKPLNRFWKMRSFCLERFKEELSFSKRVPLWETYCKIVSEITKLKEVLDEKVAFHSEEIVKAIESIEKDLERLPEIITDSPPVEIPKNCPCLEKNAAAYQSSQKELNTISHYAKQLNALKSDVIELETPHKEKQLLLDRLHVLGDVVFPRRRELLALISKKYNDDINYFVSINFEKNELKMPLFELKDQIKNLQAFAKVVSLNVGAFSNSREKLSQCWDQIRTFEKAQKKVKEEQKATFNKNEISLTDRIQTLKENKANLSKNDFDQEINKIGESIQKVDLLKSQRKKLTELLALIDEAAATKKISTPEEDTFIQIQREILDLQEKAKHWDYFSLVNEYKRVQKIYTDSKLLETHQNKIMRRFFTIKELLMEKLLEEVENRVDIEELSPQIEDFRNGIKEDRESYRKALNTSNQSIEKAMLYNELLTQTKQRLSEFDKRINPSISAQREK